MKRATAILIIIAIILCSYPYAVKLFANGAIDRTAAEPEMSSWMKDIKDEAKVSEIVIPGSHDAGHNRNMSSYISSLAGSEDLGYINVIMRDYVGPSKNAEIIALNGAKGLL